MPTKMRLIFTIIFLFRISNPIFSQTDLPIPNWHFVDFPVPPPTNDMPQYVKLLYADEVNMMELENAFHKYYGKKGANEFKEDLERDEYAKFFHYWIQGAGNYVDESGVVKTLTTKQLLDYRTHLKSLENPNPALAYAPSSSWSFLGPKRTIWRKEHRDPQYTAPWQVNIYCIAVAPSNPSILYAGSETGAFYKSIDKGLNWTPFDNFNFGRAILSVAIHPTDPNTVLLGTGTDIIRTTDGGVNFSIEETQNGLNCNSMAFSPTDPMRIYAGTGNGLYESTDGGVTWTQKLTEYVYDVEFKPNDGTTIYVLSKNALTDTYDFFKSVDTGVTFNLSMTNWGTIYERSGGRLTVTPADDSYIYVVLLTHDGTDPSQNGDAKPKILKSTDNALNWILVADGNSTPLGMSNGQGYYDLDICASHSNAEHLLAATTTGYKSTDGGFNWTSFGGYSGSFDIHPDIQAMVSIMDGATENTWVTTDGGANFSSDFYTSTLNWEARIDGLDGTNFWGFAQGWNEDYIVGGRYHNGNTALHENYPDNQALRMGGAESATGWAMHGRERYAAFDDIAETIIPDQINEVAEGSFLFTKHPNTHYYGAAFSRVMVDFEDYMKIYTGEGNSFWKSEDGGGSWEATHTFSGEPYHFDISRANGDYIYLTTDAGFFKSTDRGESFSSVAVPAAYSNADMRHLRIAASSLDEDEVWILNQRTGSGSNTHRIYKSSDGGVTWDSWATPTLDGRRWVAIAHQAGTNGGIYIASNRGDAGQYPAQVLYRDNSMSDWINFSSNLPQSANPIKLIPFYRDGKLRWGGNRGAWEIDFYEENWTPIVQPFVNGKNQICNRDTINFDSYSVAKGTATHAWSIPGASWTSINLNQREVQALFSTAGNYTATLTITQDGVSYTKSIDFIVGNECDAEGIPGNALLLSGNGSDYAATNSTFNLTTNTMTWSAWIKPDGIQNNIAGIIFNRGTSAHGLNFKNGNELGIHWNNSQWWWNSGLIVTEDEWSHVAMVVTPTETTLYLNGVASVNTIDPALATFDDVMRIGADPSNSSRRFKGEIDEVLIYNSALSQNDIRELMHFTRVPTNEPDLIAYWQFNRASGMITDRAGTHHASLIGSASRVSSTAPVGTGESTRLDVTAAGTYSFDLADIIMEFPSGGSVFPNGEVCVSRLDLAPDQTPTNNVSPSYWVIHNYGTNSTFDELTSITFDNIPISAGQADDPSQISFFKRNSGASGNTWGSSEDEADLATEGTQGSATFSTGNGQTSFSQFIVSFKEVFPLPVELLNFDAWINNEKNVELKWSSATEYDFSHFEIERSRDGNTFNFLEKLNSNGNSTLVQNYQAFDKNPIRGISYYRLKMVDLDGSFTYSEQKSIVFDALADRVILYPIPLPQGSKLTIKTELSEPIEIRFYTNDGEDAGEYFIQGDTELDLPNLSPGVYGYTLKTKTWKKSGLLIVH